MNLSKLLRLLLAQLSFRIVEEGGGAAVVDEAQDESGEATEIDAGDEAGEQDGEGEQTGEAADDQTADDGEVVVSIGDDAPPEEDASAASAPAWVRDLRKQNRQLIREKRELEQRIVSAAPSQQAVVVGAKPTLAACDFDEEKFEAELDAWHSRKREADDQQRKQKEAEQTMQAAFNAKLEAHNKAKAELKVKDFEDAEAVVDEMFSVVQRGIMIQGAKNSATLKYALGKNPKKAKELAAIADPVSFTWALAQLETQLKVTPRKAAPVPERSIRGSAPSSAGGDSKLAQLQAEADKTGDRSKVAKYIREKARLAA